MQRQIAAVNHVRTEAVRVCPEIAQGADVESLARKLAIRRVEVTKLASDATLSLIDGEWVIRLGEHTPRWRRRFLLAHEIAHFLLRDERYSDYKELERICDAAAHELLLPIDLVLSGVAAQEPTLAEMRAIATLRELDHDYAFARIADAYPWPRRSFPALSRWGISVRDLRLLHGWPAASMADAAEWSHTPSFLKDILDALADGGVSWSETVEMDFRGERVALGSAEMLMASATSVWVRLVSG